MMYYLLLLISVCTETGKNLAYDYFGKKKLKSESDVHLFSMVTYIGAVVFLLCTVGSFHVSSFTLLTSLGFAAVTLLSQFCYIKALACGPMSYTTFITCCAFVVSTAYGVIFEGDPFDIRKLICIVLLVAALALTMDLRRGHYSKKWFFYVFGSMFFTGMIGVFQMLHQRSEYSGEIGMYLLISFIIMTVASAVIWLTSKRKHVGGEKSDFRPISSLTGLGLLAGLALGIAHRLNLYLSGVMPSAVFFPLVNGGLILLSTLASAVFFHEKISLKQWIGLISGTVIICVLGG